MQIENAFNRSFLYSFSKKKFFLISLVLFFCLNLISFAKFKHVSNILFFSSIFFSMGVLFVLGIFLIRVYYYEIKKAPCIYKKILCKSSDLIFAFCYFFIPFLTTFFLLRFTLYLFNFLISLHDFLHVFSFIPFLMVFLFNVLIITSALALFFVAPYVAFKKKPKHFKNLAMNLLCCLIGVIPVIFIGFLIFLSIGLTHLSNGYYVKYFFINLFVSIFLTPFVAYFFNFSAETCNFNENFFSIS